MYINFNNQGTSKSESTLDTKLEKYVCDSFEGTGKEFQDNFNKYLEWRSWSAKHSCFWKCIEIFRDIKGGITV